jgi:glutathione S-transferase
MLKLYYTKTSAYARPVWLALQEKQLPFELIAVDLSGQQFEPEFMELNPFSQVPVLIDGNVKIIQSLAILDYLEARYPERSLLPIDPIELATVRMVQLVTFEQLLPALFKSLFEDRNSPELAYWQMRLTNALDFLEDLLGDSNYYVGDRLTLAEIVAGSLVHRVVEVGITLVNYPRLSAWSERLLARPSWQQIQLNREELTNFHRAIKVMPKLWERRRRQQMKILARTE